MDGIRIASSEVAGNGLFATRAVAPGQNIFTLQRPLITALDTKRLGDTCANCFIQEDASTNGDGSENAHHINLKACSGCHIVKYCSKQCQAQAWKRDHKLECTMFRKLAFKGILPNAARAVIRMLMIGHRLENTPFRSLKSHLQEILDRGGDRYFMLIALSVGVSTFMFDMCSHDYIRTCFAWIFTNSLTIYTPTYDAVGICIDPVAASANHSCDPNAYVMFDGPKLSFRALKSINDGDEIFITYIEPTNPFHYRAQELRDRYYFECRCNRCQAGPTTDFDKFSIDTSGLAPTWHEQIKWPVGAKDGFDKMDPKDKTYYVGESLAEREIEAMQWFGFKKLEMAQKQSSEPTQWLGFDKVTGASGLKDYEKQPPKEALENIALASKVLLDSKLWPSYRQPLAGLRQEKFTNLLMAARSLLETDRSPPMTDRSPPMTDRSPLTTDRSPLTTDRSPLVTDRILWVNAFKIGLVQYFFAHPFLYPEPFHPVRIVHKWTLVMLTLYLNDSRDQNSEWQKLEQSERLQSGVIIVGLLMEVMDNVALSHGTGSRFARMVQQKFEEVKTDMTRGDSSQLKNLRSQVDQQWVNLCRIAENAAKEV